MIVSGKYIKSMRAESGLSQKEVAKLANVSQAHIAKIENEKVDPRLSTVNRILFVLTTRKRTPKAKDIMSKNIVSIDHDSMVSKAVKLMQDFGISQIPVIHYGNHVGSISETTITRNLDRNPKALQVKHMMDKPFPIIDGNDSIEILPTLLDYHPAVLVTEKGKIKGIITKSDLMRM